MVFLDVRVVRCSFAAKTRERRHFKLLRHCAGPGSTPRTATIPRSWRAATTRSWARCRECSIACPRGDARGSASP